MTNGVRNKLTPFCLKFLAVTTIAECEHQAIKLVDHTQELAKSLKVTDDGLSNLYCAFEKGYQAVALHVT